MQFLESNFNLGLKINRVTSVDVDSYGNLQVSEQVQNKFSYSTDDFHQIVQRHVHLKTNVILIIENLQRGHLQYNHLIYVSINIINSFTRKRQHEACFKITFGIISYIMLKTRQGPVCLFRFRPVNPRFQFMFSFLYLTNCNIFYSYIFDKEYTMPNLKLITNDFVW